MLFSFNKLKELSRAPLHWTVEDMVETLNNLGFEVENYKKFTDVSGIKFGKLINIKKDLNSNNLFICETEFEDKKRIILTTAKNLEVNKYVVAFIEGSRLDDIIFSPKKINNIISEGMFLALEELGISKDILPNNFKEGVLIFDDIDIKDDPIKELFLDDYIIEIDFLSNRSDAQSYWILSTEIAASLNNNHNIFEEYKNSSRKTSFKVIKGEAEVLSIAESNNTKIVITLEDRMLLIKGGIKSINPIIDLTNLTLIMTGQPVHAYDANKIKNTLTAKLFSGKETIIGDKEILFKDNLLINDGKENISIAGSMVLEKKTVNTLTDNIVFEIGNFNIKQIRNNNKLLKIDSISNRQSSKKLGIGTQKLGWRYISNRIELSEIIGIPKLSLKSIKFSKNELFKVIGTEINNKVFEKIISKIKILGFEYKNDYFIIPEYRHDINSQQDLNEEFLRFYGYDNLVPRKLKTFPVKIQSLKSIKSNISTLGYQEVLTYTLISKEKNIINPFNFKNNIELETFVSKKREVIRNSMSQSLLEVIEYNKKRKIENINIFEIGQINDGIEVLALASNIKTFNQIKQELINLLKLNITFERALDKQLHTGVSSLIKLENKVIGWIGKIHPSINKVNAFIAEVILEKNIPNISYKEYNINQLKTMDITFELNLREDIKSKLDSLPKNLFSINVIDIYLTKTSRKVTIRIKGDENIISEVNNIFKDNK
ncbi:MAG: phenylalanine--tRNA ligase subunit beta [Mycoplasma sp.]|nr:phenylalanine--tRNA ligase subunit beta [Mycoplasma sp.]